MLVVGHDRHRAVHAHAAGVGTQVALECALVILRGRHRTNGLAIGERQQRALGTGEHLLDHHGAAGIAERAVEAFMHGIQRLVQRERHHDALARGEAVRLDDHRSALLAHVGERGLLIGKGPVGSGGDVGARHELLGEEFGTLELRPLGTRAEAGDARGAHGVRDAGHQRSLGADDHQAAPGFAREIGDRLGVGLVQGDVLPHLERAAVARSDVELAAAGRVGELRRQGVLAAAASQQQDIDGVLGCAHASSSYTRRPLKDLRTYNLM